MHPVLFEIPIFGGIKIHTYGVMVATGFLAALAWIRYQSRHEGLAIPKMLDLAFLMMLAAIVGSRIAFVIVEWRFFFAHPLDIFKVWEGGLVFYGGLLACILTAWVYLKKNRLNFWKVADVFMPGVALGHAIGRLGCFAAGCCYGQQCDPKAWYSVVFPQQSGGLAPAGVPLYPTQLIESGAEFLIFLVLAIFSRKKAFDGQILLLYLIGYSILRIFIELFRGDIDRGFVIPNLLSTSQLIGIILILVAIIVLIYRKRRHP
jgi:phosphatidylglycerol---prolipoprotein diacylglyceryl transferase